MEEEHRETHRSNVHNVPVIRPEIHCQIISLSNSIDIKNCAYLVSTT